MPSLDFKGKNHIYAHHLTVPYRPLEVDPSRSILPDPQEADAPSIDQNLIIHGDNLHALKALLPHYAGRVKCIYIDPPYNTGNEGWVYNDKVNSPLMREWFEKNSPVDSEDLERHDKWLCMMWPRLHLLRELLRDDGAIFLSIDDNEVHHLRMLMDEIFGEENFVTQVTWHKKRGKDNSAKFFSTTHDFVVVYAKDKRLTKIGRLPMEDSTKKAYKNADNDPRGPYRLLGVWSRQQGGSSFAFTAKSGEHFAKRLWLVNESTMNKLDSENRLVFRGDKVYRKLFLNEAKDSVPETIWAGLSNNANAKDELKSIFGNATFTTPKPTPLIQRILQLVTSPNAPNIHSKESDIVLDSFAGSGTTAQAALALNKEDSGNRRFILVECEDYADTITAERVRRVIHGVPNAKDKALKEGLGGLFAYCTLGEAIDIDSLLQGDSLPSYSDLASYLLHTATGISASPGRLNSSHADGHFYSSDATDFYLIYEPSLEFLRDGDAALNLERAQRISEKGRPAIVFAALKFMSQSELSRMGITFCQLPYELGLGV